MLFVTDEMKSHYGDAINKYLNMTSFSESNKRLCRTIKCFVDKCLSTPIAKYILYSKYCCYNYVHICLQTHPGEIESINQISHEHSLEHT
jgi:hypothetical protein